MLDITKLTIMLRPSHITNIGGLYAHWIATFRHCGHETLGYATCHLARRMLPAKLWYQNYSTEAMSKRKRVADDYFLNELSMYLAQWVQPHPSDPLYRRDSPASITICIPVDLATSDISSPTTRDFILGEWLRHFDRPTAFPITIFDDVVRVLEKKKEDHITILLEEVDKLMPSSSLVKREELESAILTFLMGRNDDSDTVIHL